jgi:hypothetical protein
MLEIFMRVEKLVFPRPKCRQKFSEKRNAAKFSKKTKSRGRKCKSGGGSLTKNKKPRARAPAA